MPFQISQSAMGSLCLSRGQEEEEKATVLLQSREQMEKAPEPLVESWSEVLPREVDSSFASDGFGPGWHLL